MKKTTIDTTNTYGIPNLSLIYDTLAYSQVEVLYKKIKEIKIEKKKMNQPTIFWYLGQKF